MRVAFSTGRPAHAVLPANLLEKRGEQVTIFTAAYRARFPQLAPNVNLRWVPQFVPSIHFMTGVQLARPWQRADTALYDHLVAMRIGATRDHFDIFWAWASGALASGRAARRRGARFVLDRACPHVDAQQALIRDRVRTARCALSSRTVVVPRASTCRVRRGRHYPGPFDLLSRNISDGAAIEDAGGTTLWTSADAAGHDSCERHFQYHQRTRSQDRRHRSSFGTVGGQPLRKGFLYLLQAWKQLQLPNARLLLRTDAPLDQSPVLRGLLRELPNVEIVKYVDDMSDFYRRCDAFVFPTIDDGFGMALLEAMAHGLPAITTTHCGAAELFIPDKDVIVVPAQNAEQLASAMQRLYSSAETRACLRSNALDSLQRIEGGGEYQLYSKTLDQVLALVKHGK